jgi:hypothetical protein
VWSGAIDCPAAADLEPAERIRRAVGGRPALDGCFHRRLIVYRPVRLLILRVALPMAAVVIVLSAPNCFAQTNGQIRVGRNPGAVALSPDGKTLYVANRDDHAIGIYFTTGSARAIGKVELPGTPKAIAMAPDGRTAYVALTIGEHGAVAIVDTVARQAIEVLTTCPVRDLVMIPNQGKLYLAEEHCGLELLRLADKSTMMIDELTCPEAIAVTRNGRMAYVNYQCDPLRMLRPRKFGHDAIIEFDTRRRDRRSRLGGKLRPRRMRSSLREQPRKVVSWFPRTPISALCSPPATLQDRQSFSSAEASRGGPSSS